jgi:hypothetical protein
VKNVLKCFVTEVVFPMEKFCDKNAKTAVVAVLLLGLVINVTQGRQVK